MAEWLLCKRFAVLESASTAINSILSISIQHPHSFLFSHRVFAFTFSMQVLNFENEV